MKKKIQFILAMLFACMILSMALTVYADDTGVVKNQYNLLAEAGVVINGHYVYCIDPHLSWPNDGIVYNASDVTKAFDADTQERLKRVLSAGYPLDEYGLSDLESNVHYDYGTHEQHLGTYTQWVVWAIIDEKDLGSYANYNEYTKALYKYAMYGTINDAVPTKVSTEITAAAGKLEKNSDDSWSGALKFKSNQLASIKVTDIPANMTLKKGNTVINVNDIVFPNDSLTLTVTSDYKEGTVKFSYIQTEHANEELTLYSTKELPSNYNEEHKGYQRMLGYSFSSTTAELSVNVSMAATPTATPTATPNPDHKNTVPTKEEMRYFVIPYTAVRN